MRTADGAIEALVAVLLAYVAVSVGRSLVRTGNRSMLALAFEAFVALSVPHRLFHAYRLLAGITSTDWAATLVDASALVPLLLYVLARLRLHPVAGFTLIADNVGLERLLGRIDALTAQVAATQHDARQARSDLGVEAARSMALTTQLEVVVQRARALIDAARGDVADGDGLRQAADNLAAPLDELARTTGMADRR